MKWNDVEMKTSIIQASVPPPNNRPSQTELADLLIKARREGRTIVRPSHYLREFDLNDGYGVYATVDQGLRAQGLKPAGRKLGFTNKETWKEFHLDTPIWAYIYTETLIETKGSEIEVYLGDLVAPRIEPEIVIGVGDRISQVDGDLSHLVDSIEWVAIGFEIVDCHFENWKFTAPEIVADFGAHSKLIVGKPLIVTELMRNGLSKMLENLNVQLICNDKVVDTGIGRNALGGPVNALGFLLQKVKTQSWSDNVCGGEIITTGTLTGLPYIYPGEHWRTKVSGADLEPLSIVLV